MEELQRFKKLKELGYVYEPETGLVKRNGKVRGYKNKKGYIELGIRIGKKTTIVLAHRYVYWFMYNVIPDVIDHINHITNDNRLINLRNVNPQKNQFNSTGKGFCFRKHNEKYQSYITINKTFKHLGYFNTEQEARQAYLDAKAIYHKI